MARRGATLLLMALLMPVWLLVSLGVNVVGALLDKVDRTGVFYHNALLVLRKKVADQPALRLAEKSDS